MVWARITLVAGLLLLLAAFAYGTESRSHASVADQRYDCGAAISPSWLVPGTPDAAMSAEQRGTDDERRAAATCEQVIRESRVVTLTAMGAGALVALIGWTILRERGEPNLQRENLVCG